ncbi:hypothetical protein ACTXT7_016142 [Hymenolepis weldensis]
MAIVDFQGRKFGFIYIFVTPLVKIWLICRRIELRFESHIPNDPIDLSSTCACLQYIFYLALSSHSTSSVLSLLNTSTSIPLPSCILPTYTWQRVPIGARHCIQTPIFLVLQHPHARPSLISPPP